MAITRNSTGPGTVVLEAFDDEAGDAAYLSTEKLERGCRAETDPDLDDRVCSFGTNPPALPCARPGGRCLCQDPLQNSHMPTFAEGPERACECAEQARTGRGPPLPMIRNL